MSGPYILYGARGSGAAVVEAALVLAQFPFRTVDAASWEPGPGLDALKEVNPLAQIPTLVLPGGAVMTESAAILIHLGLAHPASGLLPAARAPAIRAAVTSVDMVIGISPLRRTSWNYSRDRHQSSTALLRAASVRS